MRIKAQVLLMAVLILTIVFPAQETAAAPGPL